MYLHSFLPGVTIVDKKLVLSVLSIESLSTLLVLRGSSYLSTQFWYCSITSLTCVSQVQYTIILIFHIKKRTAKNTLFHVYQLAHRWSNHYTQFHFPFASVYVTVCVCVLLFLHVSPQNQSRGFYFFSSSKIIIFFFKPILRANFLNEIVVELRLIPSSSICVGGTG